MLVVDDVTQHRDGSVVTRMRATRSIKRDLPADAGDLQEAIKRDRFFRDIDKMLRAARESDAKASVPSSAYVVNTGTSAMALAAATAKTGIYINSGANDQPSVVEWCFSFDGVTASAVPVLIETCLGTAATNSTPGTASTTFTPLQTRNWPSMSSGSAAAVACTSEPTVLTVHKPYLITPNGGVILVQFPLGREMTGIVTTATAGKQLAWRLTAPAVVNTRGYVEFEE